MALKHIEMLAYKQNDEDALLTLGRMYLNGIGTKTDTDKAFACFKSLAKKYNNALGYYYVGYMLEYGIGRAVNKKKAFANIEKSSNEGCSMANYALSLMYSDKKFGVDLDLEKAKKLKGKEGTKDYCFVLYDKSIGIDKEIANLDVGTVAKEKRLLQIVPKQQESIFLCKKASEEGCPEAKLSYGIKLLFGDGTEKDYDTAYSLFIECLPFNLGMAFYALGYMYDLGLGVSQNCWTAYSYYYKASALGEKCADVNIAYCNLHGFGCDCNQKKGFEILRKLSKDGNPYADYHLGLCYLNGYGCKIAIFKAKKYLKMASSAKIARAFYHLGLLSDARKNGGKLDKNAAVSNLDMAFELGDMDAAAILSSIYSKSNIQDDLGYAKKLNELSVANRSSEGYLEKAKKCMSGEIYEKNFDEADKFYQMAANAGNREASRFLYNSYKDGLNEYAQSDKKCFEWMEQSAYNGDKKCYLILAQKYFSGSNVCEKNAEKSAYWFAKLMREGTVKREVAIAKKMLSKFAIDSNECWNIKKDIDYQKKHGIVVPPPQKEVVGSNQGFDSAQSTQENSNSFFDDIATSEFVQDDKQNVVDENSNGMKQNLHNEQKQSEDTKKVVTDTKEDVSFNKFMNNFDGLDDFDDVESKDSNNIPAEQKSFEKSAENEVEGISLFDEFLPNSEEDQQKNETFNENIIAQSVSDDNTNQFVEQSMIDENSNQFVEQSVSDDNTNQIIEQGVINENSNQFVEQSMIDENSNQFVEQGVINENSNQFIEQSVSDDNTNQIIEQGVINENSNQFVEQSVSDDNTNQIIEQGESNQEKYENENLQSASVVAEEKTSSKEPKTVHNIAAAENFDNLWDDISADDDPHSDIGKNTLVQPTQVDERDFLKTNSKNKLSKKDIKKQNKQIEWLKKIDKHSDAQDADLQVSKEKEEVKSESVAKQWTKQSAFSFESNSSSSNYDLDIGDMFDENSDDKN